MLRQNAKLVALFALVIAFLGVSQLALLIPGKLRQRRYRILCVKWFAHPILWVTGITITHPVKGSIDDNKNYFIVSNHLSYIDVLAIALWYPSVFITSMEVRHDPILGTLCKAAGCLFVERRKKSWLQDEIDSIATVLNDGFHVVVFPEGTTTAGDKLLPFRKSLMQAAAKSGRHVLPLCINYRHADGQPINERTRDALFYYGEHTFLPHLLRALSLKSAHIELHQLEPILVDENSDRKQITALAEERIGRVFCPIEL